MSTVYEDAPTQALTRNIVVLQKAIEALENCNDTITNEEFVVCGGKRKKADEINANPCNVKLLHMLKLQRRTWRKIIKGELPLIVTQRGKSAKQQYDMTLKDAQAYLGDLQWDYDHSDNEDIPLKVATDDDSDEDEGEEDEEDADDEDDEGEDNEMKSDKASDKEVSDENDSDKEYAEEDNDEDDDENGDDDDDDSDADNEEKDDNEEDNDDEQDE